MSVLDNPRLPLPKASDIKLVVSDVDGTLLDSHHQLPETNPTYTVLRRLRAAHPALPVVVSTGKQYPATAELRAALALDAFPACHLNGSVLYAPGGEVLFAAGLDVAVVLAVYERMQAEGCSLFWYDYDRVYQVLPSRAGDGGEWAKRLGGYGEDVVPYEESQALKTLQDMKEGKIKVVKMAVCEDEARLPEVRAALGTLDIAPAFALTQALTFCLELIPAAHNKGTLLLRLLEHLNATSSSPILPEHVAVFGDGQNDVSMLEVAGISVAMGNAMEAARKAAKWETLTNDEGGVGRFLERVFFPESA